MATLSVTAPAVAKTPGDALVWDTGVMRDFNGAETLVHEVAARLPFFVPRAGLLLLDWHACHDGDCVRVRPRVDMHSEPWLDVPAVAIKPTGATIQVENLAGEQQLIVRMPVRKGRPGASLPLSTGLMRLSMQAHDEHLRFLPVVLRSDLSEDRFGGATLHLHRLDMATLVARRSLDVGMRKAVASTIAERVLAMMSLPGAGLTRQAPMIVNPNRAFVETE